MSSLELIMAVFIATSILLSFILAHFVDTYEKRNKKRMFDILDVVKMQNLTIKDLQKRIVNLEKLKENE